MRGARMRATRGLRGRWQGWEGGAGRGQGRGRAMPRRRRCVRGRALAWAPGRRARSASARAGVVMRPSSVGVVTGLGGAGCPADAWGGRVPEVRRGIGRAPRGVEWSHASVERGVPDGAARPAGAWRRAPGCPQPRFGAGVAENGSLVRFAIFACVQTFAKPQVSEIVW